MRAKPPLELGLIGWPVQHSFSPRIHQVAMQACGLNGAYRLYPIRPDEGGKKDLQVLLNQVRQGQIHGLNVTVPYKQQVLEYMDVLAPAAEAIGAVNTIYQKDGELVGDNTDASGFERDLTRLGWFSLRSGKLSGGEMDALILGAGGSARAVSYALLRMGARVMIAARRKVAAMELAVKMAGSFGETPQALEMSVEQLGHLPVSPALVVNTTPVGMSPLVDVIPWPGNLPFPPAYIYDLIYNPGETKLMREARKAGLIAANGSGMLIEQALLAFTCWTGETVESELIRKKINLSKESL